MRNLTIGVLSIIFALISLPALANSALIAELTRLDDARRSAKALHVEYDRTVQIGSNAPFTTSGNVWERQGENKYRYRSPGKEVLNVLSKGEAEYDLMFECSLDGSVKRILTVPLEEFPLEKTLDASYYGDPRYHGSINKNDTETLDDGFHPFLPMYIAAPPPINNLTTASSYKDLFENLKTKRIKRILNDDGDKILRVEFSGFKDVDNSSWKNWALTVDFNFNKGGLISKYIHTFESKSGGPSGSFEITVKRFEENGPRQWYPKETEVVYNKHDPVKGQVVTTVVNKLIADDQAALQLGDLKLPKGLIVFETDLATNQTQYHIWGEGQPLKTFTDLAAFDEFIMIAYQAQATAPIGFAILIFFVVIVVVIIVLVVARKKRR